MARRIEAKHPELGTGLLAAVEEDAATPSGRLGFLQSAVIRQALDHRRAHDWDETVPTWRLRVSQLAHAATLGLLGRRGASPWPARLVRKPSRARRSCPKPAPATSRSIPATPRSNAARSLSVVARFKAAFRPRRASVVDDKAHKTAHRGMTRSLEDPTFAGHVESVDADLAYRVEFQGKSTETFHVQCV